MNEISMPMNMTNWIETGSMEPRQSTNNENTDKLNEQNHGVVEGGDSEYQ